MAVKFQWRGCLQIFKYTWLWWPSLAPVHNHVRKLGILFKVCWFSCHLWSRGHKNFREFIYMLLPYMLSATIVSISLKWLSLSGNIVFQKGFTRYVNSIKLALTYPKYGVPEALTHSALYGLQFRRSCFFFTYIAILANLDSGFRIIL